MESQAAVRFPRIAIQFCVQCKWNLRAAYYAQELLQTFSNTLGEVSLVPVTGGIFTITLYHVVSRRVTGLSSSAAGAQQTSRGAALDDDILSFISKTVAHEPQPTLQTTVIWDRKRDGGFPETKELKNRVRNVVDPDRDMGHVDRALRREKEKVAGNEQGGGVMAAVTSLDPSSVVGSHEKHGSGAGTMDDCEECKAAVNENVKQP